MQLQLFVSGFCRIDGVTWGWEGSNGPSSQYLNLRLRRHRPALVEHGRARLHLRAPRVRVGLGRLLLLLLEILDGLSTTRLLAATGFLP